MFPRRLLLKLQSISEPWRTPWNCTSRRTLTLYEENKRSGYKSEDDLNTPWFKKYSLQTPMESYRFWRDEFKMFVGEMKEHFSNDAIQCLQHGDVKIALDFRDPKAQDKWIITVDADYKQGKSSAQFVVSQHRTGIFSGNLIAEPIADGFTKAAGYANLGAPPNMKSFARQISYDWSFYTHFVIKFRGDGRNYMINLGNREIYDLWWNDLYNYPLYTRGGPYWQIEKIPFSKFLLSHKGRAQDQQEPIEQDMIDQVSITASDGIDGPFKLEIDYIALEYDAYYTEEFAYELYVSRKFEN